MLRGVFSSQGSVCCRCVVYEVMRLGSMGAMQASLTPAEDAHNRNYSKE